MPKRLLYIIAIGLLAVQPGIAFAGKIEKFTLDNGLTVVFKEEHKAPVISFQVWYKVGSINEVTGHTGLSHLFEHMMFKGTEKYPKGEYSRLIARYGGDENAFTSRDYTAFFMNWSPEHLPLSVALEADRMRGLMLDDKEFFTERDVVMEERRMRIDDNPIMATVEQMYAQAYLAHPYRNPVIGWMTDLENLSPDAARAHYRRYYAPNNATVVLAGDFDARRAKKLITEGFGPIPPTADIPRVTVVEPEQEGERRLTLHREAQLPFVFLGYHTPNWESPDAYPLVVLAKLLFDGKKSRLYQRLIRTDQSAVDSGGEYDPLSADDGLFYFYGVVAPGHDPAAVEDAIYEEIAKLADTPPDKGELTRAKNQVEAAHVMGQDSMFYQAMQYGQAESVGAGAKFVTTFPKKIRKVTAKDVSRVAQQYLLPTKRTVAVLLPKGGTAP